MFYQFMKEKSLTVQFAVLGLAGKNNSNDISSQNMRMSEIHLIVISVTIVLQQSNI